MWPDGGSHSQPIHLLRQASIRQIALQIPAFRILNVRRKHTPAKSLLMRYDGMAFHAFCIGEATQHRLTSPSSHS